MYKLIEKILLMLWSLLIFVFGIIAGICIMQRDEFGFWVMAILAMFMCLIHFLMDYFNSPS